MTSFNWVDVAAAVILLWGLVGGLRRGLSGELARVIAAALAVFGAWRLAPHVADLLLNRTSLTAQGSYIGGLLALIVVIYLILAAVRMVLRHIMVFAFKGKLEKIGGALCGLARSALLVSILILVTGLVPGDAVRRTVTEESLTGRLVFQHVRPAYERLSERYPELHLPAPAPEEAPEATDEDYLGPLPDAGTDE